MRAILLMAAMVVGTSAVAKQNVSAEKILKPGTIIVRQKIDDPSHIEVVPVAEKLAPGKIVENLNFQKVAMNSEVSGQKITASNELDQDSSRSSWGYYYGGIGLGYGYGMGMGYYGYGCTWSAYCGGGYGWAYPRYGWGGYNFGYAPYWGYAMGGWNYAYCNWGGGYWW